MANFLTKLKDKIYYKIHAKEIVAKDEEEKKEFPKYTKEQLENSKYYLGEIFIGGLATNNGKNKVKNILGEYNIPEKYAILRNIPNTYWFMDIETGEYYKLASKMVNFNSYWLISTTTNEFKHDNYYVVEINNFIAMLNSGVNSFDCCDEVGLRDLKEMYKNCRAKNNFINDNEQIQLLLK